MKHMKNKFTQYCSFCIANYFPALSISNYKKIKPIRRYQEAMRHISINDISDIYVSLIKNWQIIHGL